MSKQQIFHTKTLRNLVPEERKAFFLLLRARFKGYLHENLILVQVSVSSLIPPMGVYLVSGNTMPITIEMQWPYNCMPMARVQ